MLIATLSLVGDINHATNLEMAECKSKNANIIATTGITHLSRFSRNTFTSSALHLINYAVNNSIPFPTHLITCTQTPDRLMPCPSLDILNSCDDFLDVKYSDLRTGCTGFVDCAMLSTAFAGGDEAAVVYCVTGDISSRIVDPDDHSTSFVFGDAINLSVFHYPSRSPNSLSGFGFKSQVFPKYRNAIYLHNQFLVIDGLTVMTFVVQSVVPALKAYLCKIDEVDDLSKYSLVLHQANKFIVELVNKSIANVFPDIALFPFCLGDLGNSSSSTIPLAIARLYHSNPPLTENVVVCGFGVGMALHMGVIRIEDLVAKIFYEGQFNG